jgi:uncharacterized protein DUF2513
VKRDMELIRKMALAVEASPSGYAPHPLRIEGYTDEQIGYHAHLMIQGGLAEGPDATDHDSISPEATLTSLTWEGHDFLDAARNETIWKKALAIVKEKGGSVAFSVLKELLMGLAKQQVGIS